MPKPKMKKGLIKKGSPLPGQPKYRFDSSHLTDKAADKREEEILTKNHNMATQRVLIPRQHAIYKRRYPSITPKTPKLR